MIIIKDEMVLFRNYAALAAAVQCAHPAKDDPAGYPVTGCFGICFGGGCVVVKSSPHNVAE